MAETASAEVTAQTVGRTGKGHTGKFINKGRRDLLRKGQSVTLFLPFFCGWTSHLYHWPFKYIKKAANWISLDFTNFKRK